MRARRVSFASAVLSSGGGKAREFLDRMRERGVGGEPRARAGWFVDHQPAFYRDIVARNPGQGVFLQGWLNRSRYMKEIIAGNEATGESRSQGQWPIGAFAAEAAPTRARADASSPGAAEAYR